MACSCCLLPNFLAFPGAVGSTSKQQEASQQQATKKERGALLGFGLLRRVAILFLSPQSYWRASHPCKQLLSGPVFSDHVVFAGSSILAIFLAIAQTIGLVRLSRGELRTLSHAAAYTAVGRGCREWCRQDTCCSCFLKETSPLAKMRRVRKGPNPTDDRREEEESPPPRRGCHL